MTVDGAALIAALQTFESGTLWHNPDLGKPNHPCKGYADANATEADALDKWIRELASTGSAPPLPTLATATGRGLAGMLTALAGAAPTPPPTPSTHGRIALWREGGYLTGFTHLNDYATVCVSRDGADVAAKLPGRSLIYSNASGVHAGYTEGLSYTAAAAISGGILTRIGTSDYYVVNHVTPALNDAQAKAIVAYAKSLGVDGVFLDDTVPQNPYSTVTPPGWKDGMRSMVAQLHAGLKAAGMYLVCNSNAFTDPSLGSGDNGAGDLAWAKLLDCDGVMCESWQETRDGKNVPRVSGPAWNQQWDGWQAYAIGVQDAGKDLFCLTYTNPLYGYASMLLVDKGRCQFASTNATGTTDPWGPWAVDVGDPIDPPGTNPRKFTKATVRVDHTNATAAIT